MALTAKKVYAILKRQISDMDAKLNSPVRYRGTVATADLLPLNPDIGDMYNIESKSIYGEAGMNVAWNGVVWDTMGAPIDMSLYFTKEEAETVIQRLVTEYFEKNPVKPGATTEQAQQIEQNKKDVNSLKEDLSNKITKFYASNQGETHLADSDNGKIADMMVYGKSEQKSTTGKNLLKLSEVNVQEDTNGLLATINADGSISVTGTSTSNWSNITKLNNECHTDNATYTFSVDKNPDIVIGLKLGRTELDDANYQTHKIMQNQLSYTFETGASNEYCSLFLEGLTVGKSYNFTIYPMLELGTEATAYEPYTGGIPSPNPDYPQEIKSVVNPTVKVCGKNLLGLWEQGFMSVDNGISVSPNVNWIHSKEYTKINAKNYAFSSDSVCRTTIYEYDRNKKYIKSIQPLAEIKNAVYTPSSKCAYIKVEYNYNGGSETITPNEMGVKHWLQLELGSTPTAYEPYHEQTVTLPYTLNAIPVSSGGNVTIDGQQYIADYIDVENGKIVKYVKKLFLKPFQWSKAINKGVLRFYASTIDAVGIDGNKVIKNVFSISSHFTFVTGTPDRIGTFTANADGTNANIGFAFSTDTTTSSDDFNNWILNNKPFVLLPVLKEELPLTSEQTQALKELATYYPTTNISVNSEQLDGYTVFNYPISMENGWNYVKQQIGDTRDYIYDMDARTQDTDLQAAEAYVNSEYAVALTELEV